LASGTLLVEDSVEKYFFVSYSWTYEGKSGFGNIPIKSIATIPDHVPVLAIKDAKRIIQERFSGHTLSVADVVILWWAEISKSQFEEWESKTR